MKNMKKLLQKAMVFTLTAAMLIGTPLTASATGLLDLYQTGSRDAGATDNIHTGTNSHPLGDTNTHPLDTNTHPLDTNTHPLKAEIQGIKLDQTNVQLLASKTYKLQASIDWSSDNLTEEDKALEAELLKSLTWKSSDGKVASVVALRNDSSVATVRGISDGATVVTASLDTTVGERQYQYTATANVNVFQYATELEFNKDKIKEDAFTGNSLILDEYVIRKINGNEVEETADKLTFSLIDDGGKKATLKNGVLKLNKETDADRPVRVMAFGQIAKTSKPGVIHILLGTNATKLKFEADKGTLKGSTLTYLANDDGLTSEITATVTGKKGNKDGKCTDKVTWSSSNPDVVEIVNVNGAAPAGAVKFNDDKCTVDVRLNGTGSAQILGKVSSGKTFKLTVKVNADLTGVVIPNSGDLYTGQIIDLNDMIDYQKFEKEVTNSTNQEFAAAGLVKWDFVGTSKEKSAMKKVAKLNTKTGVLEILSDASKKGGPADHIIKIKATNKNKPKNAANVFKDGNNEISFKLLQTNVRSITIKKADADFLTVTSGVKQRTTPKEWIDVKDTAEYQLVALGEVEGKEGAENDVTASLGWTASGNGKIVRATKDGANGYITALKKGSAKVTVSGSTVVKKGKGTARTTIKATFNVGVNAPSEHITLSVKNKNITAKYKKGAITKQTVSVKAVLDKGTTTKNKVPGTKVPDGIVWAATLYKADGSPAVDISNKMNLGKLTLENYGIGDQVLVTATVQNTGASDSVLMTVVYPTNTVKFYETMNADGTPGTAVSKKGVALSDDTATSGKVVYAWIDSKDPAKTSGLANGKERTGVASYTISGKGAASVKVGENGELTLYPLKEGAVTIKFVMSDGKKASLKATVAKTPDYIATPMNMMPFVLDAFEQIIK